MVSMKGPPGVEGYVVALRAMYARRTPSNYPVDICLVYMITKSLPREHAGTYSLDVGPLARRRSTGLKQGRYSGGATFKVPAIFRGMTSTRAPTPK